MSLHRGSIRQGNRTTRCVGHEFGLAAADTVTRRHGVIDRTQRFNTGAGSSATVFMLRAGAISSR